VVRLGSAEAPIAFRTQVLAPAASSHAQPITSTVNKEATA